MSASTPSSRLPWTPILANTLAFAVAFATWVMLGPSARAIAKELGLSPNQAALLKALPILTGSVLRIPVGILADRWGATRLFPILLLVASGAAVALAGAHGWWTLVAGALVLGLVGTTFVTGVQAVSAATPPAQQGTALGIFGAGNAGTAITTMVLPLLLVSLGWRRAFLGYAAVVCVAAIAFAIAMRGHASPPRPGAARNPLAPLGRAHVWLLGLYYMASFGTFVAATLALGDVYADGYGKSLAAAGALATTFTFTASLTRIPAGALADRYGATALLRLTQPVIAIGLALGSLGLPLPATAIVLFIAAIAMGAGMAATFKAIPSLFPREVGTVGGLVGALGGVAGFYLPLAGAWLARTTGSVFDQFLPLALLAGVSAIGPWLLAQRAPTPAARPA